MPRGFKKVVPVTLAGYHLARHALALSRVDDTFPHFS
jgi:hypothetical protein